MKKQLSVALIALVTSVAAASAHADVFMVPMYLANEKGATEQVGEIVITPSDYGLIFTPALHSLAPGLHGFHVHEVPSCEPLEKGGKVIPAGAALGHWDPEKTGMHGEPWGKGHMGDLPPLFVEANGEANQPVLAPRLKNTDDLRGHALMLHFGGDNHSDHPEPLGGGGARMACGVIQ